MSLLTAPVNGCDMSTSCTPKSVFGDFATPCQSSSISSTPGSVSSFATPHSRAQPRAVSLSARTIADAHAALEELCSRSRSTPSACLDTSIASSDDDTWVARSTSAASQSMTVFDSAVVPSISLGEYGVALASRIPHLNAELTLAAVVLCRRYIGTMRTAPTAAMMHRLYATAFYLVMCSHSDVVVTPSNFAAVAGLDAKEMPRLTRELLLAVDWRTQVTRDQLETLVVSCDPLL